MSAFDDSGEVTWISSPAHEEPATASSAVVDRETARPFDLARLADALTKFGPVLWLERRIAPPSERTLPRRHGAVLLEHPALAALTRCASVVAHTAVTNMGPREWLCFRDADGTAQAKLFILPDTDYLAWDEMIAACKLAPTRVPQPQRWSAHGAFLRGAFACLGAPWRARVVAFEQRRLPWLRTLGARSPLRMSLIGFELARAIARDEVAELVSPFRLD
jgi:hypothetical protein